MRNKKEEMLPFGVALKDFEEMEEALCLEYAPSTDGSGDWFVYSSAHNTPQFYVVARK